MPTENRSSTIEQHDHIEGIIDMVSVPRELADRIQLRLDHAASAFKAAKPERDQFRAILARPAPQPHAEPIAWMVGTAFWWTKEEAERDAAATGLPVVAIGPMPTRQGKPAWFMTEGGVSAMHATAKAMSDQQGLDTSSYCVPLYTHTDPCEVERLHSAIEQQKNLIASLRAELVESRSIDASAEPSAATGSIPDGYCIMPRLLTAENGAKALLLGEFKLEITRECPECLELDEPAEGCEICDGEGEYAQRHTIPWEKIKFIYSEAVKGLALQPNVA